MNFLIPWLSGRRMKRNIFWLRASYWTGAVAGLTVALRMILPGLFPFPTKAGFPMSMHIAGLFFLGWSLLLIWAAQKPQERKRVLLLTFFPILTAWMGAEIFAILFIGLSFTARLPFWFLQGALFFLFIFAYSKARHSYAKWWTQRV
jgi:hypothetical protein